MGQQKRLKKLRRLAERATKGRPEAAYTEFTSAEKVEFGKLVEKKTTRLDVRSTRGMYKFLKRDENAALSQIALDALREANGVADS